MTMRTNCFLLLTVLLGILPMSNTHANDSIPKSVILYTPYTKISVSPGASIDYSIDLINNTDKLVNANLSVSGLSSSWKHEMKSGGWNLSQLAVLPKEKKTFNLKVDVPLKVSRGSYHFVVSAGEAQLPLNVVVAQQGTYQTEFTTDQPNMQGNSKSTFTFNATLKNQTADQQLYALMAKAPRGWNVIFKPNYKQATSAQVEANSSQNVSIDITPPANVEAGSYKIPVRAATGNTSAELELEVVVTGSYQMELTTPRGLLSSDVTAGDTKRIELEIKNTGSSLLKDIQLSANKPVDWDVAFEPSKIEMLKAGETATAVAILKASKKALPGDYVTTMMAKTPEVNADAQFRIAVKTPMIWGWVGVLIIRLSIRKGEIFGLLGPNGAGKSTTILMMLGLTEPTSGIVEICGINSTTHPIEVKRKIGYLPEDVGFYDDMTGLENLMYTARLNGIPDKEAKVKALELMKRVGLEDQLKKKTGKYSRGMRQRLGLADVLIKNPEIIILDEPTSGIDPAGVQEFIELIRWLSKEEGLTVLFSSHHLDQAQKVCDRVGLFSNGKILALIDMAELKEKKQELSDIYNHYFEEGGERHE